MLMPCRLLLIVLPILATAADARWSPMPLRTAAQVEAGLPGGEGCQRVQSIAIDAHQGSTLFFGTDVGGIYRSLDGGASWTPCNGGLVTIGAAGFAIDPRNPDRVLLAGDNAGNEVHPVNGIWLSTDRGASWTQVLARSNGGRDETRPIVYDPSSYDETLGGCRIAYWAEELNAGDPGGRLWRSEDGGQTWRDVAHGSSYGGGQRFRLLSVLADGTLLIANDRGLWRSEDGGQRFRRLLADPVTSLATVPGLADTVWATTADRLLVSQDGGRTFTRAQAEGVPGFSRLQVSPADSRRMVTADPKTGRRWVSHDAGATWTASVRDLGPTFAPHDIIYDSRNFQVVWHPTDAERCFGTGPGDLITASRDGGLTWEAASSGYTGIMIGGLFNFATERPGVCYFGSQDFNGALTEDGGATWRLINLTVSHTTKAVRAGGDDSDAWGWVYGGYSPDGILIYGGNREYQGKRYDLWISEDGGATSRLAAEDLRGIQVSYADPRAREVLFCWSLRSGDRGRTWTRMDGCDGVFTASAGAGRALFGALGKTVVRSDDHGLTWTALCSVGGKVRDVAYDHRNDRLWIASDDQGCAYADGPDYQVTPIRDRLPTDSTGAAFMTSSIAVDPVDPRVVYAGACGTGLFIQRDASVARSLDGGETWERLTGDARFAPAPGVTAAQMTSALRVDPQTRRLWAMTCCYGCWTFPPPSPAEVGQAVASTPNRRTFPAPAVARISSWRVEDRPVTQIRDLSRADYVYGKDWKLGDNVAGRTIAGRTCLVIESSEHGGAGMVMGGIDLGQAEALVVEVGTLPGNEAATLQINVTSRTGAKASLVADLPATEVGLRAVVLPLPPGQIWILDQIQVQGANFSASAKPLKVALGRLGFCPTAAAGP